MFIRHANGTTLPNLAQDSDVLTMGITPSADRLHQGHYLTAFNLLRAMNATRTTTARLFLDDREFNNQQHPVLPTTERVATIGRLVRDFVGQSAEYLHNDSLPGRVVVQPMSEFYGEPGATEPLAGFELYKTLGSKWQSAIRKIFADASMRRFVTPVCPDCKTGKRKTLAPGERPPPPDRARPRGAHEKVIHCPCGNDECGTELYTVDVAGGDTNWTVHYALLAVRDFILSRRDSKSVTHVYGGDYGTEWGNKNTPKAERMSSTIEVLRDGRGPHINHFTGPLIVRAGKKLSKSKGDGCDKPDFAWMSAVLDSASDEVDLIKPV